MPSQDAFDGWFSRPSLPQLFGIAKAMMILTEAGLVHNASRYFVREQKVTFTVVPFDYDLENNPDKIKYDGVFISNGPGDPVMCTSTINSLKWLMRHKERGEKPVPIFGICLGNQLLALAAGAKVSRTCPCAIVHMPLLEIGGRHLFRRC